MCSDMCSGSTSGSPWPRLLSQQLLLHTLSVAYMATISQNWLTLMSGQQQSAKLRTPLIRLTNELRRLTPQPPANAPRRELWLVK